MKRWLLIFLLLGLSACKTKTAATPDAAAAIQAAVAATLTAQPQPTAVIPPTAYPTYTPRPAPSLTNLFCEYGFCLGHPSETYFFDALMVKDTHTASNYAYGVLMTYQPNLFIEVTWRLKAGEANPYDMLAVTAGDDVIDLNALDVFQSGNIIITTAPILKTASPNVLPYGLAAAWECGDREFGWKAYTAAESQASGLLQETLSRFSCQK